MFNLLLLLTQGVLMKKKLLLIAALCGLLFYTSTTFANDSKQVGDELQRRSLLFEVPGFYQGTSYPMPFQEIGNPVNRPPVSTGYYFVDSDDEAPDYWRPIPEIVDTTVEPNLWRRILPGARLVDPQYWIDNPQEGLRFFRNPAYPASDGNFFTGPTDSTDDAIAGPIPIGFSFIFNGLRYDSFYVSTNGIIALTNRRYTYDATGQKAILPGATSCYDPMSMDWFTRGRSGDGLADNTPDNWGYQYSVLANAPTSATAGIRTRGGSLDQATFQTNRSALIAPFFGDMHLSQFNPDLNQAEDFGKVYFKRSNSADKLIIYFINIAPHRTLATPFGNYTGPTDARPGVPQYISGSAQVVLNRIDSSVTIIYERFEGVAVVSGRGVPANTVFRYNTTAGVFGYARHVNYGQTTAPVYPWASEYYQSTHYFMKFANAQATYPHNYLAVKFKQWKNTVRVVDIQYRVRKSDPNADLDFSEQVPSSQVNNYELLAGEERIGAIQPVALIQNLTNNIQGPQGKNFQPQQLRFRARFRIINEASGRIIYNRLVPIDSTCLALPDSLSQECTGDPFVRVRYVNVTKSGANYSASPLAFPGTQRYNGIPPYGYVQILFPPFEANEFVANQIGRMRAYIIADPTNPITNEGLGDEWPFDDTTFVRLFVMKRLDDFSDDVTSFHIVNRTPMPSTLKWVNINAEVQAGDEVSKYPLPPRGEYSATNNKDFTFLDPNFSTFKLQSPVIRMNRDPEPPANSYGGDELRSFPINLIGRYNSVLSLSVQRSLYQPDWPRGWSDQQLIACEPRTVVNGDPFTVWTNYAGSAASFPDEFAVELMQPSPNGIQYITNVEDKRWRNHPRRGGAKAVTNMAAYILYGAGGAMRGFLEGDKDSALSPPTAGFLNGLRPDIYDDGIDYEYKKIFIPIPDTFISAEKDGAKNFRFRLKLYSRNQGFGGNKKCISCIPDDDDPFFVDNVRILFPSEITDLEISVVKAQWPYTIAPASQADKIPIRVKMSNNTSVYAPSFLVKVMIYRNAGDPYPIYCRVQPLPGLAPGTVLEYAMPDWNARKTGPGRYFMLANLIVPGGDIEPLNDTTFTFFDLRFGDVFAYDPAQNPRNDVPDNSFTGVAGRGLNLYGFAAGGNGSIYGPSGGYDGNTLGAGYVGGSGSGQIAVKFTLTRPDTIKGYKAYFGELNQAGDDISFEVYTDQGQPGSPVPGTLIYRQRGYDEDRRDFHFGEYVQFNLPRPVVLNAGSYWMAIGQMGETGLELGASKSRVGMRTTSIYIPPPVTAVGPVGGSGYHLVIEKDFRRTNPSGNLINNNFFAFENTRKSGQWIQFMPTIGNPAYAHLHHYGISPADNYTATLSRGTWIPMIRPYFGNRTHSTNPEYEICPDIPVELTSFDGQVRSGGIDLFWETASEHNNYGFYVERRVGTKEDTDWNSIGFVKGVGNSAVVNRYNYLDKEVVPFTTYQYRLRQVDRDGIENCETFSKIITLTYDNVEELTLAPNSPNPFTTSTQISFYLPTDDNVKLEILDVFGNVVKTLFNGNLPAKQHIYNWDGRNEAGSFVSSGTYITRLIAGDQVRTSKMTLVR